MTLRGELERASLVAGRGLALGTLFDRLARIHGRHTVAEEQGARASRINYRQAAERIAILASGIGARIEPGEPVVIAAPNGYEFLLLCMAASRAGGVAVPVNPKMRPDEVDHVIAHSGARLIVHHADEVAGDEPIAAVAAKPRDVAAIFYTSGTTGKPKGARLTHGGLLGQVTSAALWPRRLHRDEAVVGLPVAHIMGFVVLLSLAAAGVPVYFLPRFRPDTTLDAIESRRATVFIGVPAMYRMMLEAGAEQRDLRSVRLWASGADVMPAELAKKFKRMGAMVTLPFLDSSVGRPLSPRATGWSRRRRRRRQDLTAVPRLPSRRRRRTATAASPAEGRRREREDGAPGRSRRALGEGPRRPRGISRRSRRH